MDIDGLVVREGDRATATGRLVRDDLGDWFEPAFPIAEPGGLERRVRAASNGAVRVAGADFDAAAGRFEKDGAVEGWATVTGTWSGEQLRVEKQDASVRDPAAHPRWVTPPCPPPEGGWPAVERRGDIELSYDLGDLADTGAAVAITLFHPGSNQAVLVVAAADLAAVEARLRPQLGNSLCVVPSRWTKDQLDDIRDQLHQRWQHWNLYQLGPQHSEDGQAHITARLVRVLPEIATWAASLPSGLVALEPWLTPAKGDRNATSLITGVSPQVRHST
jgi:hypothetical protein